MVLMYGRLSSDAQTSGAGPELRQPWPLCKPAQANWCMFLSQLLQTHPKKTFQRVIYLLLHKFWADGPLHLVKSPGILQSTAANHQETQHLLWQRCICASIQQVPPPGDSVLI
jgi:hypothetical protein